jgi:hypothetical protein
LASFSKEHIVFIVILTTCALLRLFPLFEYQFTYDELSGLERTQFSSFDELIEKGVKIDAHPFLVQLVIFCTIKLFGYITWIVKLPFILCSLGSIVYAYLFGLRNFSKQAGLLAAAVLGFSLIFVFYAPIARMYVTGVFFSMALLYYFCEIFFNGRPARSNFILLGVFTLLSAFNHHINALFAFTVFVAGFFMSRSGNRKQFMILTVILVVAYLPVLPVTLYQLGLAGIGREQGGWLEAPELHSVIGFLKVISGTGGIWIIVLLLMGVAAAVNKSFSISRKQLFLLIIFLVNYIIVVSYSILRAPVFQYSVMLFSSVALIQFFCSLMSTRNVIASRVIMGVLLVSLVWQTYIRKNYFHEAVKTVFEYQFERTVAYKDKYGNSNVYPLFFDADEIMKKIYFKKYGREFECKTTKDSILNYPGQKYMNNGNQTSSLRMFGEFIRNLECDYVAMSSSMPLHQQIVREKYPYLLENTQTQGIHYKLYSRVKEDEHSQVPEDKVLFESSGENPVAFRYRRPLAGTGVIINPGDEFPFDAMAEYHEVVSSEGSVILTEARLKSRQPLKDLESCISVTANDPGKISYGYSAKSASDFMLSGDSVLRLYSDHYVGTNHRKSLNNSNLSCYIWNREHEPAELLSFNIKVIDHWHNKWNYWE